jgi:hypothetical protein
LPPFCNFFVVPATQDICRAEGSQQTKSAKTPTSAVAKSPKRKQKKQNKKPDPGIKNCFTRTSGCKFVGHTDEEDRAKKKIRQFKFFAHPVLPSPRPHQPALSV